MEVLGNREIHKCVLASPSGPSPTSHRALAQTGETIKGAELRNLTLMIQEEALYGKLEANMHNYMQ